ncbi:MAG: 30S ribosomal protein S19e [Candidatus Aenigmatarchaeota archaeon]
MKNIKEVEPEKLIKVLSEELKKIIEMPEWAKYVKTGVNRERPPEQEDWWWTRAASILRRIAIDGPIGVQKLRTYYGGLKRLGHQPSHFRKGGGKIIRTILQQLEKAGLVTRIERKGRVLTPEGQKFINKAIKEIKSVSS